MARPPSRGIGFLCMRRASFGTSIAPTLCAKLLDRRCEKIAQHGSYGKRCNDRADNNIFRHGLLPFGSACDKAYLSINLIQRFARQIGGLLCALLVDLLQIILVVQQIGGLFTNRTQQLDNGLADCGLELTVALAVKLGCRLFDGLAGRQRVNLAAGWKHPACSAGQR